MTPKTRIDLTGYRVYLDVLTDKVNKDALYPMSMTDVVKMLIEKAMNDYCPDIEIVPLRKRYYKLEF